MKSALILLILLVLPGQILAAPEDSTAADPGRPNSLQAGMWAAQFSIDGWFNSAGVFFKNHRADNRAIRFGATFSFSAQETDATEDTSAVVWRSGEETRDYYSVNLELVVLRYSNPLASGHVYYGVGPFFGISGDQRDGILTDGAGNEIVSKRSYDSWQAGAKVVIGAEWFASRALSLNIEYSVFGGYRSQTYEATDESFGPFPPVHRTEETDDLFVSGGNARFGLSIYF